MNLEFARLPPQVSLRYATPQAFDGAIAAARTCYAHEVIDAKEITQKQRDLIGPLTFDAGHHTVYQHATFEFSLSNVSRHLVWSVLHGFPYYNSDQQSQRYVKMDKLRAYRPTLAPAAQLVYDQIIQEAFAVYHQLSELLLQDTLARVKSIRRVDRHPHERLLKPVQKEAIKKSIEIARYVLPIATFTSLVYTVSGLVLHRLQRLMHTGDLSTEAQQVIGTMLALVKRHDPSFFAQVGDEVLQAQDIPEFDFFQAGAPAQPISEAVAPFRMAKLLSFTHNAQDVLATAAQYALGPKAHTMSSEELLDCMLNPRKNRHRVDKLNLGAHSPLMRCLQHVNYTFVKRLSHSADSQNQRHRTVLGSRPFFSTVDVDDPDYYTPMLIEQNPKAKELYDRYMEKCWQAKRELVTLGVSREQAVYVLPNAVYVRFVESGSLLNLMHKWTQRTCLNAQEEIFHASMEELQQVTEVHPFLAKHLGPPCVIRNKLVSPRCTEGSHFCGVPVWNQFPNIQRSL